MIALRRGLALAAALLLTAACGSDDAAPKALSGYELQPAPRVATIALPDGSDGDVEFPMKADEGRLLIVYFGYTSCPDVCPTTLAEVKKAFTKIGNTAERVDVAMITIDPNRDSDEILTGYVQSFLPNAHALRTEDTEALQGAADAFGASFSVTTAEDGTVEVSHSAAMYVVDSAGDVVLTWPFGIPADGIADDLGILFDRMK
ncbi:MAG: SCO family protein [Ilumatobacteraceae bacterium]